MNEIVTSPKKNKVLMLVENAYPHDVRVFNEATLLRDNGYRVRIIAVREPGQPRRETLDGIDVYRVPKLTVFKKTKSVSGSLWGKVFLFLKSLIGYVSEYVYFTGACLLVFLYIGLRHGVHIVHAHNPPDTLFVVGAVARLLGRKYVFDHHDLSAELYQSRFNVEQNSVYRALLLFEKLSFKLANRVIATNESYRAIAISRGGVNPDHVYVVRNGPDLERVAIGPPDPDLAAREECILVYLGALNPQDGVDYLLRALHFLRNELKRDDFYCVIVGCGDSVEDLRTLNEELELTNHVRITGWIEDDEMISILNAADICVDPDPSSPLNDKSTWIKIMEYMALGKPIVSFDLSETRFSAGEAARFVTPNDEPAFAAAIVELADNPALRKSMGEFGLNRVRQELSWKIVGQNLLRAYASMQPE